MSRDPVIRYDRDKAERLCSEAQARFAAYGTVGTADALDMADQLEAAGRELERLRAMERNLATINARITALTLRQMPREIWNALCVIDSDMRAVMRGEPK